MSGFSRFINSSWEGLKISLSALGINKTRSILTTLCIIIGIVMVTLMNAVSNGMDTEFDKSMAMIGQNVVYVETQPWNRGPDYEWWEYRSRRNMKLEYVKEIQEASRLASDVAASVVKRPVMRYEDVNAEGVLLAGVTEKYFDTSGLDIEEGRVFTAEEVHRAANVVVLGATLAEKLFDQTTPLGKDIRIRGKRFEVIGLLEKQGKFLGLADMDRRAITPITAVGKIYGMRDDITISVKFPSEELMREGEYEIEGIMRRIRGLEATEENDFEINKPQAFKAQLESFKTGLYLVGGALTALSLIIGGIGVMNIMFVSVRERTKEIGIRKAVGAKAWEILYQFLIEAVVMCLLGGVIGLGIAYPLSLLLNQLFIASIDLSVVFSAFILCSVVGLVFGFIPAYKAAKSDPIESLRYE
ncbi:ABC transporter permease [Fodinibius halophilus]|uniref:FtsX-like permease family protein n=1 Tax=Fodinibius halophilus TaxID=1736908 RepID=A0A6M1T284_9BACT|nr:ABC transporter permease [Fodinibius halophilus]NGP88109.1 FtsX-like permease family protein [Fodinibius halophilus]